MSVHRLLSKRHPGEKHHFIGRRHANESDKVLHSRLTCVLSQYYMDELPIQHDGSFPLLRDVLSNLSAESGCGIAQLFNLPSQAAAED